MNEEQEIVLGSVDLSSSKSTRISLEAIRDGEAGLNERRKKMLTRVPDRGDYASFKRDTIELKDLAYLTAAVGDEFALLRGKDIDVLFHGTPVSCGFDETLEKLLIDHKLEIVGHSHPGEITPVVSSDDREALAKIGQKKSKIISAMTGEILEFGQDMFEDL